VSNFENSCSLKKTAALSESKKQCNKQLLFFQFWRDSFQMFHGVFSILKSILSGRFQSGKRTGSWRRTKRSQNAAAEFGSDKWNRRNFTNKRHPHGSQTNGAGRIEDNALAERPTFPSTTSATAITTTTNVNGRKIKSSDSDLHVQKCDLQYFADWHLDWKPSRPKSLSF